MVQEFIRRRGVTACPGMGTPELAQLHVEREKARAEAVGWTFGNSRRGKGRPRKSATA